MRKILIALLLSLASVGARSPFLSPVERGCVVPYQTIFIQVDKPLWDTRAAQAWCESGFNPKAKSEVGAVGLTQFMPGTWNQWAKGQDPTNPTASITAQDKYMRWLEARCDNNLNAALGSYNAGLGNIRKAQFKAEQLGMSGDDAWMRVYPSVQKNQAFVKQTLDYITRNQEKRTEIKNLLNQTKG